MKKPIRFGLSLFTTLFSVWALAQETSTDVAASSSVTATPKAAPTYFLTYGFYRYDLQGTNTANTGIYRFESSAVDVNLITATWLYSPRWTLLAFVPHIKNMVETKYEPIPGGLNYKTRDYTEGLGDVRLMGMTPVLAKDSHLVLGDLSLTLPTGSIDKTFTTSPSQTAAYNMQMGSGTPDVIFGATYSYTQQNWVSSARGYATVRGGRNARGWALGNEFFTQLSSKYAVTNYFEAGVSGSYKARDAVQGRDEGYEKFSNWDGAAHGDGHQYYHAPQINWHTEVVAKLSAPTPVSGITAGLEGGVSFWRGAINKDDIRLDMPYWVSAFVTGGF